MKALEKRFGATPKVASWAVFVEAIDQDAASFYRKRGFIELPEDKRKRKLFLPMKTITKLFSEMKLLTLHKTKRSARRFLRE